MVEGNGAAYTRSMIPGVVRSKSSKFHQVSAKSLSENVRSLWGVIAIRHISLANTIPQQVSCLGTDGECAKNLRLGYVVRLKPAAKTHPSKKLRECPVGSLLVVHARRIVSVTTLLKPRAEPRFMEVAILCHWLKALDPCKPLLLRGAKCCTSYETDCAITCYWPDLSPAYATQNTAGKGNGERGNVRELAVK
jgi:hypothetical protein